MKYIFSFTDLWPYIAISIIFIFCYLNRLKSGSTIIFITLFLFCALRYDVGWDYISYVEEVKKAYGDNLVESRYEPMSKFIFDISGFFRFYPLSFIVFSFLTLYIVYISINKYSTNKIISWVVYFSMPLFFFASLSTIRQSLATAIVFYSYVFVKEKKYIYFILAITFASMFHLSALFGFFILPIVLWPSNRVVNVILFFCSFILSSLIKDLLTILSFNISVVLKFQQYINLDTAATNSIQYLYYAITLFNLLFYKKLVESNFLNKYFISITTFGVVVFNILSFEPISATRISAFYLMFLLYIIPSYSDIFSTKYKKIVDGIIMFIFLILSFYYIFMYINSYEANILEKVSFLPYKFWWNHL